MKRGFTLLELLVVIGIMGLLGTVSIGGYRAITRGMEERGAVDNVENFLRAAFQRALIDRQPVVVYFWNETIKTADTQDDNAIVVGKAVAVRKAGRISRRRGQFLYDEFADIAAPDIAPSTGGSQASDNYGTYLYQIDRSASDTKILRSRVATTPVDDDPEETCLLDDETWPTANLVTPPTGDSTIFMRGWRVVDFGAADNWVAGTAYGFEFLNFTMPHNYIFGDSFNETKLGAYSEDNAQVKMVFGGGKGGATQLELQSNIKVSGQLEISALRPDTSGSGKLKANKVKVDGATTINLNKILTQINSNT